MHAENVERECDRAIREAKALAEQLEEQALRASRAEDKETEACAREGSSSMYMHQQPHIAHLHLNQLLLPCLPSRYLLLQDQLQKKCPGLCNVSSETLTGMTSRGNNVTNS